MIRLYYAEVYNTTMGCGSSRTPILVEKPPLAVTAQVENASCMGDGQILLSASGPNPISSYSFRWSTGDLGYELDALSRGLYTVTVTDANGCTTESSYYIESDAFDITLLHDNSDCIVSPNRNLYAAKKW
ncbi:MAG: hypothetical protein IPN86_21110 [Saprospiraceae bacterium]|nr:hypothetical protein [Saprospiraceae bacterium]